MYIALVAKFTFVFSVNNLSWQSFRWRSQCQLSEATKLRNLQVYSAPCMKLSIIHLLPFIILCGTLLSCKEQTRASKKVSGQLRNVDLSRRGETISESYSPLSKFRSQPTHRKANKRDNDELKKFWIFIKRDITNKIEPKI